MLVTEQNTNTERRLTWGPQSSGLESSKRILLLGWLCTVLSLVFKNVPFLGMILFYASLGFGISLIRQKKVAVKINGWIITLFFAVRFILSLLVWYRIITV